MNLRSRRWKKGSWVWGVRGICWGIGRLTTYSRKKGEGRGCLLRVKGMFLSVGDDSIEVLVCVHVHVISVFTSTIFRSSVGILAATALFLRSVFIMWRQQLCNCLLTCINNYSRTWSLARMINLKCLSANWYTVDGMYSWCFPLQSSYACEQGTRCEYGS
jgi:hypothetical protein